MSLRLLFMAIQASHDKLGDRSGLKPLTLVSVPATEAFKLLAVIFLLQCKKNISNYYFSTIMIRST